MSHSIKTYNNSYHKHQYNYIDKKTVYSKKKNPIAAFVSFVLLVLYSYFVCPYNFEKYFAPLFLHRILNFNLKLDASDFVNPTRSYIHNSFIIDKYILANPISKSKEMTDIKIVGELSSTRDKIINLANKYPNLKPAVYVWEYSTGKGFGINANSAYPSASIIKIPIVFELIRLIDRSSKSDNPIYLSDKRTYSEFFKTGGSGDLQKTKTGVNYSLDYLANITISNSDNSATNMLLYEIGGMDGFNRMARNLGLKTTSMSNWLPDLEGTNETTAYEISKILYNIDNPNYINPKYKNILKEYLGNTKNVHLIKEKLPKSVIVLHKTGDIASMLGDSGIVYTDNGKKYIITILVQRPHNDYGAKLFIQEASKIIYDDIKSLP